MVFLFPVLLAFIYYKFGREKSFTVPKFLSFVPRNRKPWLVNLVFRKDPFDYDENGFYATLLDLHKREIIKIETGEEKKLKIKMLGYKEEEATKSGGSRTTALKGHVAGDDEYEIKVLRFLNEHSLDNVFDTDEFEQKLEKLRNKITEGNSWARRELSDIRNSMNHLMRVPEKKAAEEFVMSGKKYTWMIFGIVPISPAHHFLFIFLWSIYLHCSFITNHSPVICFIFAFRKVEGKLLQRKTRVGCFQDIPF